MREWIVVVNRFGNAVLSTCADWWAVATDRHDGEAGRSSRGMRISRGISRALSRKSFAICWIYSDVRPFCECSVGPSAAVIKP